MMEVAPKVATMVAAITAIVYTSGCEGRLIYVRLIDERKQKEGALTGVRFPDPESHSS